LFFFLTENASGISYTRSMWYMSTKSEFYMTFPSEPAIRPIWVIYWLNCV